MTQSAINVPSAPDLPPPVADEQTPEAQAEAPAIPTLRKVQGQLPPHDLDAEAIVLGSLLLEPSRRAEVEGLLAGHFYSDANRLVYTAIGKLAESGADVDPVAVKAALADAGQLKAAGGAAYLAQLVSETPACRHLAEQAERIRARAELRHLIGTCQWAAAEGYGSSDVVSLRSKLIERIGADYQPIGSRTGPQLPWVYGGELAQPVPPHPWAIPGLQLGPGRPAMVVAYAGTAKTIAMQSALLAYAAGRNVWGAFPTDRGGIALHLDYEQGAGATRRRYQRLAFGMGVDLDEVGGRLGVVSFPRLYLTDADAEAALEREIQDAGLVLVDSLRAAMPGVDENDSAVRRYVDMLTRVSERTQCTIVLIHHAGKEKVGHTDKRQIARGSSALLDAVGCSYLLTMTSYDEPRGIAQTKMPAESDGTTFADAYLAIEDVEGPDGPKQGLRITYQTAEQAQAEESPGETLKACATRIVEAVRGDSGLSVRRLRALVGGSRTIFDAALEMVLEDGRVESFEAQNRHGGGLGFRATGKRNGGDDD